MKLKTKNVVMEKEIKNKQELDQNIGMSVSIEVVSTVPK